MQHLRVMSPAPRDVWHEVHAADSKALVTQRPDWLDCLCEIGGYEDASRFYETRDGRRKAYTEFNSPRSPAYRRAVVEDVAAELDSLVRQRVAGNS